MASAAGLPLLATRAQAQAGKTLRLVVPFTPGGSSDILARALAPKLQQALGQNVVVDNRPGSNGNISAELVANARPDGHTLLLGSDSLFGVNPHLYSRMPVDLRKAFVPRLPDAHGTWVLLSADYSQVELRIMAHFAGDESMKRAFAAGKDIHAETAAVVFNVMPELVTREMRSRAKAINFGLLYGMGPARLARDTGLTVPEARQFIERYFHSFPRPRGRTERGNDCERELLATATARPFARLALHRERRAEAKMGMRNAPFQGHSWGGTRREARVPSP